MKISKSFTTSTGKHNTISLTKGDIAKIPAQALIAPINSAGMWCGAIDGVIHSHAGNQFHAQATAQMPLNHLDIIVARKRQSHTAMFQDVIFVIDDLETPLHKVICAALEAAGEAGYTTVSLPAIRTGVMLGVVEKTAQAAVVELFKGIVKYYDDNPDSSLSNIIFVIYDSNEVYELLQSTPLLLN